MQSVTQIQPSVRKMTKALKRSTKYDKKKSIQKSLQSIVKHQHQGIFAAYAVSYNITMAIVPCIEDLLQPYQAGGGGEGLRGPDDSIHSCHLKILIL